MDSLGCVPWGAVLSWYTGDSTKMLLEGDSGVESAWSLAPEDTFGAFPDGNGSFEANFVDSAQREASQEVGQGRHSALDVLRARSVSIGATSAVDGDGATQLPRASTSAPPTPSGRPQDLQCDDHWEGEATVSSTSSCQDRDADVSNGEPHLIPRTPSGPESGPEPAGSHSAASADVSDGASSDARSSDFRGGDASGDVRPEEGRVPASKPSEPSAHRSSRVGSGALLPPSADVGRPANRGAPSPPADISRAGTTGGLFSSGEDRIVWIRLPEWEDKEEEGSWIHREPRVPREPRGDGGGAGARGRACRGVQSMRMSRRG